MANFYYLFSKVSTTIGKELCFLSFCFTLCKFSLQFLVIGANDGSVRNLTTGMQLGFAVVALWKTFLLNLLMQLATVSLRDCAQSIPSECSCSEQAEISETAQTCKPFHKIIK